MPLLWAEGRQFACDAVLLDKDGTLIDFKTMWLEWSRYIINQLMVFGKGTLTQPALEQAMGIDLANWQVDPRGPLAHGNMLVLQEAVTRFLRQEGVAEDEAGELIQSIVTRSETAVDWGSLAKPVAGLQEKLHHLRQQKFKLAVVTADSTDRALISLNSIGILDYFETVIGADLVPETKPAPDMTYLACTRLGLEPGQTVVIGDSPWDISMARDAGAASIGVLSGVSTREQLAGADAVIKSVAEVGIG